MKKNLKSFIAVTLSFVTVATSIVMSQKAGGDAIEEATDETKYMAEETTVADEITITESTEVEETTDIEEITVAEETLVSEESSTSEEITTTYEIITAEKNTTTKENSSSKKDNYKVFFDYNGGSGFVKSITLSSCDRNVTLPKAKRRYYKFKGWYTAKNGGKKVNAKNITTLSENQTLYAHWKDLRTVLKKVSVKKYRNSKGNIYFKLRKGKKTSSFVIYCSPSKKFQKEKTKKIKVRGKAKKKFKLYKYIKNPKIGRFYYFKIRAYTIDSTGKKVWGKYSTIYYMIYDTKST